GDRAVRFRLDGRKARYVRVTALHLWKRLEDYCFALAELQAFAEGKNVALNMAVTALDTIEAGRWSTHYLVDDCDSRQRLVERGGLACVSGLAHEFKVARPEEEGQRRAALAEWIADSRNVLTWRSIVNRIWHYHFGKGLVDTPNDFGGNGGRPTHPELLDWLA